LKKRAKMTREDGVFTLKLDEGVSLAMLVSFARDMFPDRSTDDIGVWPADEGELVVSVRGGRAVARFQLGCPPGRWQHRSICPRDAKTNF
jgi:hypothetical protein